MAQAMLDSTNRIFELIGAVKDYSWMDQAPIQEVDLPQSLETTLTMLQSRLGKVKVERGYAAGLPRISAYASELNQVWMSLLENALDAMQDEGKIMLNVELSGDFVVVEIWDNGPGIPPEIQARIFEPFFTTKAPGGSGAGAGYGAADCAAASRLHSCAVEAGGDVLPGAAADRTAAGVLNQITIHYNAEAFPLIFSVLAVGLPPPAGSADAAESAGWAALSLDPVRRFISPSYTSQVSKQCFGLERRHEKIIVRAFWISQTKVARGRVSSGHSGRSVARCPSTQVPMNSVAWSPRKPTEYCRRIGMQLPTRNRVPAYGGVAALPRETLRSKCMV